MSEAGTADEAVAPIYASDTLRVLATVHDPARFEAEGAELVTFEPLARTAGRDPFGARFAKKYELNALHIVPIANDWYQYPDLMACLEATAARTARGATVYGSSMGAYAATTYGDAFPECRVIALSPQYSIRRELVPFEKRWAEEAQRIAFLPTDGQVAQRTRQYLFYDPVNVDGLHARMIANRSPMVTLVEVPGGGHPVGPVLVEAGCLSQIILQILRGEPTREELLDLIGAAVTKSPQHYLILAVQAPLREREPILRAGLALDPEHVKLRHGLAFWLHGVKRREEALPHYEYVVRRRPFHPQFRRQYLKLCGELGIEPDPALAEPPAGRAPRPAEPEAEAEEA